MAAPTPTLNRNDSPEYTEKHTVVLSESEIVSMEGQLLRETQQLTTVTSDDPAAPEERLYKEVSFHLSPHPNAVLYCFLEVSHESLGH